MASNAPPEGGPNYPVVGAPYPPHPGNSTGGGALTIGRVWRPARSPTPNPLLCVWFPKGSALMGGRQEVANGVHSPLICRPLPPPSPGLAASTHVAHPATLPRNADVAVCSAAAAWPNDRRLGRKVPSRLDFSMLPRHALSPYQQHQQLPPSQDACSLLACPAACLAL